MGTIRNITGILVCLLNTVWAAQLPSPYEVTTKKTGRYVNEGVFIGGEKTVTSTTLKDIRRGPQGQGERLVFDFEGNGDFQNKVPYFLLNINAKSNKLILSVWSDVSYDHNSKKIAGVLKKSRFVRSVNVMPRLEDGLATMEVNLKSAKNLKVEAFYLTHPARIILDLM